MPAPLVSIVIPVFNKYAYTAKCLRAVAAHTGDIAHEVIVVDNGSSDQTARALAAQATQSRNNDGIRYRRNAENLGFARASNQGAAMARGRFLLFLNNDTEPHAGWAAAMVAEMERDPRVAVVGSKLLYPDGLIQHAGVRFAYAMWQPIMPMHVLARQPAAAASERQELDAVTAACMLVRPEVFVALGGFDEGYVNGYEDVDFCLEVRARGHKIVFTPASVVTHHESVTEGRFDSSAANTERLMARWIDRFDAPPFQFDVDFRRTARPLAVAPERPGVSVIVAVARSIATIAPCLENIWYTTAAQDEIVVVDDTGGGASGLFAARFAARHADRVRLVTPSGDALAEMPGQAAGFPQAGFPQAGFPQAGFPQAYAAGLRAASRPLAALVGPNVRVTGDWLGRLVAHRHADPAVGVITATLGDSASLGTAELLTPVGRTDPMAGGPAANQVAAPPPLIPTAVATSFTLFGATEVLRALAGPGALFGSDPGEMSRLLAAQRLSLVRAPDVVVYRLNEVAAGADPLLRERYLTLQRAPDAAAAFTADARPPPLVSVIIVGGGDPALMRRCVDAVRRHTEDPLELVVVENGVESSGPETAPGSADNADDADGLTVIRNARNEGFAFAANQGLDRARGRLLAVLHDDVVVGPGWMRRARALLETDTTIGAVGPAMNECDGAQRMRMVHSGGADDAEAFAALWAAEHQGELAFVPRLSGACLIVRREVVMRMGGFDTLFGVGKGADDDFSVRVARAGWKLAIALDVFVHHEGGASHRRMGRDPRLLAAEGWRAFCAKWDHPVAADKPAHLARLGRAAFELARDRVPLRYAHVFCPEAPPLALTCHQPVRFLCVADDLDQADDERATTPDGIGHELVGWRGIILRFVQAFTARDPVALVVRIEPPRAGAPRMALTEIAGALARAGVSITDLPEVLFEATALPPACRGSIYTAVRIFLCTASERDRIRAREAAACGVVVVDANLAPVELRRIVAAYQGTR